MKRALRQAEGQCGFTMIELIAVLLIIGIIATVAAVRMSNTKPYDLASQVEVVKNHLRYAQVRAMNTNTYPNWGINFDSATTYYLFQRTGSNTRVLIPGENDATVDLVAKKSALTITTGGRVTFDSYGSPGSANDITIATNGGTITVTKNTGFIP